MRKGQVFAAAGMCAALACALSAHSQTPRGQIDAVDPAARLALFGAAFAPKQPSPSPHRTTASAFLPGRGVITWDITGMTPEQAQEAQIEAMGRADADAVQREIDAANAQKRAPATPQAREERAFAAEAGVGRSGLNVPDITGSHNDAGGVIPLNRSARAADVLGVKSGETLKSRPRLYAFGAVSGRTVGFNVLHDDDGWKNGGFTTDREEVIGQRQAGVAWRKGEVQTSLSYIQEKTHTQILDVQSVKDHRVMLSVDAPPQAVLGLFKSKP